MKEIKICKKKEKKEIKNCLRYRVLLNLRFIISSYIFLLQGSGRVGQMERKEKSEREANK